MSCVFHGFSTLAVGNADYVQPCMSSILSDSFPVVLCPASLALRSYPHTPLADPCSAKASLHSLRPCLYLHPKTSPAVLHFSGSLPHRLAASASQESASASRSPGLLWPLCLGSPHAAPWARGSPPFPSATDDGPLLRCVRFINLLFYVF